MRELLKAHAIANAIRMKRALFDGAFVIVEGQNDKRVYGLVTDSETCAFEIAHGRDNVVQCVQILNGDGFEGALGIIDADFDHIVGAKTVERNLFRTDLHDLDCMIVDSSALDRVLEEFGSEERIANFTADNPVIARRLAMNTSTLGCLRLISRKDGLNLKFVGLKFARFIRTNDLTIDVSKMVREVINNSQMHHLNTDDLEASVSDETQKGHDCWQISSGHDIVEVLSIAFRTKFSGKNSGSVSSEVLSRSLRLAYEANFFKETRLYSALVEWEKKNINYPILDHT